MRKCDLHLHTFQQNRDLLNVTYVKPKDRRCFEQAAKPYGQFFLKRVSLLNLLLQIPIIIHIITLFFTGNKKNISETERRGVVLERELLHITRYMSYIKGQTLWSTNRLIRCFHCVYCNQGHFAEKLFLTLSNIQHPIAYSVRSLKCQNVACLNFMECKHIVQINASIKTGQTQTAHDKSRKEMFLIEQQHHIWPAAGW